MKGWSSYRDRVHLGHAHTGEGGAIQHSPLTLYCWKLPPCHFWLITQNRTKSKSCCVTRCTANKLKNPELRFYKLSTKNVRLRHRLYKNMDVVSVTSPVRFCKAFLKPKVGGADRRHLGKRVTTRHNRKWAKRRHMGGAGCWNHAHLARQWWQQRQSVCHSTGHALNYAEL